MRGATIGATPVDRSKLAFLLTRPMRGATFDAAELIPFFYISTHTPHAGRDLRIVGLNRASFISTHTPHAGRDKKLITNRTGNCKFLLTRPMRGAT